MYVYMYVYIIQMYIYDVYNTVQVGISGDENNSVLDGSCSDDEDNSVMKWTSKGRSGSWVGIRVGSATSVSQSISHSSSSSSTKTPIVMYVMTSSHTWSAGTSDFSSRMVEAAGSGSIVGIGGTKSVVGIS